MTSAEGGAVSTEHVIVETHGRVGLIRLNRPQALNALNRALMRELAAAVDAFEADDAIGCMVITGSDKAFAAGADIKEMADKGFTEVYFADFCADWHRVAEARKPVVAAVAGFALGGGCELAQQCDIVIAADNAKFGQPEIKLGIIPGIGGTQRLTHPGGAGPARADKRSGGGGEPGRQHPFPEGEGPRLLGARLLQRQGGQGPQAARGPLPDPRPPPLRPL